MDFEIMIRLANLFLALLALFPSLYIAGLLLQERPVLANELRPTNLALIVMFVAAAIYSVVHFGFFVTVLLSGGFNSTLTSIEFLWQNILLNLVVWIFAFITNRIRSTK